MERRSPGVESDKLQTLPQRVMAEVSLMTQPVTNDDMTPVIEEAFVRALDSKRALPKTWLVRADAVTRIGQANGVVILGTMLLARATNPKIDPFALNVKGGSNAYNARSVAEYFQKRNQGRFHFGSKSKNPFNTSTWFGNVNRLDGLEPRTRSKTDQIIEIAKQAARDLSHATADDALEGLAAFLHVRIRVLKAEQAKQRSVVSANALSAHAVVELVARFVGGHSEGGKVGQAIAGAVLDTVFKSVEVGKINSPQPGDIHVKVNGLSKLVGEVKQAKVSEDEALMLAEDARFVGADTALLVALARDHVPLDRDRVRRDALKAHNVALTVCESVAELIACVATFSNRTLDAIAAELPDRFAKRLEQQDVSEELQARWAADVKDQNARA